MLYFSFRKGTPWPRWLNRFAIFRRRPVLVTRHRIWISPQIRMPRGYVKGVFPREQLPDGRWRVEIETHEEAQAYWVRLTERQLWRIINW